VERGVRFVMLNHASWDDHTDLNRKLKTHCDMADKPTAALIRDLKQRGLLDSVGGSGPSPLGGHLHPGATVDRPHVEGAAEDGRVLILALTDERKNKPVPL